MKSILGVGILSTLLLASSESVDAAFQSVGGDPSAATAAAGGTVNVVVEYNSDDNTLSGLGLRLHYDSSFFDLDEITPPLSSILPTNFFGPLFDTNDGSDFDGDTNTDRYIQASWLDFSLTGWPNTTLPVDLYTVALTLQNTVLPSQSSTLNFTRSAGPSGFTFQSTPITVTAISEPPTLALLLAAGVCLVGCGWRRRKQS